MRIGPAARLLDAELSEPAGPPRGGAVVCHPHPQMGGDMDNPVVLTVARVLVREGFAVLRFNFGGVGDSAGSYSGGPAEVDDVRAALAAVGAHVPPACPLVLAGYSFGAWAALRAVGEGARVAAVVAVAPPLAFLDWAFLPDVDVPVVFVAGDRDGYCPAARLEALGAATRRVERIAGADHFFAGADGTLADAIARAVRSLDP